ncbi:MAG: HAD-IA family hydrolase [Bacteroidota bacterium]
MARKKREKPFPEFYQRLLDRYNVNPAEALFIDDSLRNVKAAEALGIRGIHFKSPRATQERTDFLRVNMNGIFA